jgi:hypothetical protein
MAIPEPEPTTRPPTDETRPGPGRRQRLPGHRWLLVAGTRPPRHPSWPAVDLAAADLCGRKTDRISDAVDPSGGRPASRP